MINTSYIELSEGAVKNNIEFIQNQLGEGVTFSSVVKGNAYGHSINYYCPLAHKYGVRHFSVFSAEEAFNVTKALPNHTYTLLIMGYLENEELAWAIESGIHFYVFEMDKLNEAIRSSKKLGIKANIHLELETGMNRTGFNPKMVDLVLEKVKQNLQFINVQGVCTHLAGAEDIANLERITEQHKRFDAFQNKIKPLDWINPKWHMASSAASIRYPHMHLDMVRIGILQYGFFPTQETLVDYLQQDKKNVNSLQRVISWKTRIMDIKTIPANEYVGYGTSFFTNRVTRVAMLPIGYSSGYSRSLSNKGKVLIKGKRLDVIGNINMSMLAVDITNIEGVEKGDEVVLIGKQADNEIAVSSFSDFSQQINYELLTRLPQDIPRHITQ
ncbi:MAG: alanine racemase [Flavobacteriaceae bacterium]